MPTQGNTVPLRDHIESRLTAIEKAREADREALQHRLEGMNEIREAMRDAAAKYASSSEVDIKLKEIENRLRILEDSRSELAGKASQSIVNLNLTLTLISLFIGIFTFIIERMIH